jgi:hypothetical protein
MDGGKGGGDDRGVDQRLADRAPIAAIGQRSFISLSAFAPTVSAHDR